ncbi:MAG TPA: hypothetical protein P5181_01840 [Dermatophilaceae bacterium]|mgnify:CR=1 FL=1|nr:hypothetical protein [Dermatophilaceae bacterium]
MTDHEPRLQLDPGDDALLGWLRRVIDQADPEPPHLRDLGSLALSVRRVDGELAALVADSATAGSVRRASDATPGGVRLLAFELDDVVVDVEARPLPGHRVTLVGVVEGVTGDLAVEVETAAAATIPVTVDGVGRFALDEVSSGLIRLRVRTGELDVTTEWVRV